MLTVVESIVADIPTSEPDGLGLVRVDLRKLQETVLLAGPNGGGKTRLLALLHNSLTGNRAPPSFRAGVTCDPSLKIRVVNAPSLVRQDGAPASQLIHANMLGMRQLLRKGAVECISNIGHAQQATATLLSDFLDSHNPMIEGELGEQETKRRKIEWDRLVGTLARAMGLRLGFVGGDRAPTIDGRPLDEAYAKFSEGQKKLFSFIVGMLPGDETQHVDVVIFDEPETHLHPAAAVELLKGMQRVLNRGQLWVATHSPMILAALGWEKVSWAEKGAVSFAGRNTRKIVDGLVGGEDNVVPLRALLAEPDRAAIAQFMYECLCAPPAASMTREDPQFEEIADILGAIKTGCTLRILDWGAQQGRFAYWLSGQEEVVRKGVDYYAYDISQRHSDACMKNIEALCGAVSGRHAVGMSETRDMVAQGGRFDAVLLCNVLHEIPPGEWAETFRNIAEVIEGNGRVLVAEDLELPVGELPSPAGFILLSEEPCRALFGDAVHAIQVSRPSAERYSKRLICFAIPAERLAQVSLETTRKALTLVCKAALEQLKRVRESSDHNYRAGSLQALFLAQYGNASLALEELERQ